MMKMAEEPQKPHYGMIHPDFEALVQKIIGHVDSTELADLRKDFHTRLRLTLTQPDNTELVEDLWDFFYDWCVFEQHLPEKLKALSPEEEHKWRHVIGGSNRSVYTVSKAADSGLKLKDLFSGKSYWAPKIASNDFLGISRGDIVEGRLILLEEGGQSFSFVRRPSYHPVDVHNYIKAKVKQFRKSQDYSSFQAWLWILVGMYLKHRIYAQMPIDKIYDDNSRI
jgi:hypothetical protein